MSKHDTQKLGMLNVTQHWFDNDMDQWGKSRGEQVHEGGPRFSPLLGPDGTPLVYARPKLGFDLTPKSRR
jgi:hypothetical protein